MSPSDRWFETDLLAAEARARAYPTLAVEHGMVLTHTASSTTGTVAGFAEGDRVLLVDRWGTKQVFRALDGAFVHEGKRVALRTATSPTRRPGFTASGSIRTESSKARTAKASRIWVEGVHDAELIETVWGDDLRDAAVVVEPMHGADDLAGAVAAFGPRPGKRLGILLDHLVVGSKEHRLASGIDDPHVLICGHPYVDVWAAIQPATAGLSEWPEVPPGRPWKEGILQALGVEAETGEFWRALLARVSSYRDLAVPLVNSVERLIDFVTEPAHDVDH